MYVIIPILFLFVKAKLYKNYGFYVLIHKNFFKSVSSLTRAPHSRA